LSLRSDRLHTAGLGKLARCWLPALGAPPVADVQLETAATNARRGGSGCALSRLARHERRPTRPAPPLCKQDVRVRVSPTVLQRLLMLPSRCASLSFSLIRNHSAGFMIGCMRVIAASRCALDTDLESVLGSHSRGFESRILRCCDNGKRCVMGFGPYGAPHPGPSKLSHPPKSPDCRAWARAVALGRCCIRNAPAKRPWGRNPPYARAGLPLEIRRLAWEPDNGSTRARNRRGCHVLGPAASCHPFLADQRLQQPSESGPRPSVRN
jgi:hypothetical protein